MVIIINGQIRTKFPSLNLKKTGAAVMITLGFQRTHRVGGGKLRQGSGRRGQKSEGGRQEPKARRLQGHQCTSVPKACEGGLESLLERICHGRFYFVANTVIWEIKRTRYVRGKLPW